MYCDTMVTMNAQLAGQLIHGLRGVGRRAVDMLTPPICPVTGEPVGAPAMLSPKAWGALQFIEAPFCDHCGVPFATDYGEGVFCPSCIAEPPVFARARAAIVYDDASHKLVVGFKHSDRTDIAAMFGAWMASAGRDLLSRDTLLVPVPLHSRRLFARRYNQSALLAKTIALTSGAVFSPHLIVRIRATLPQKDLSATGRVRNVAGAFRVRPEKLESVRGARIVLVDDVLTTGATLSACARVLLRAGARSVDALSLARVVKGGIGAI